MAMTKQKIAPGTVLEESTSTVITLDVDCERPHLVGKADKNGLTNEVRANVRS